MELELVLKSNLNMEEFDTISKYGGKVDGDDYALLKIPEALYQQFYLIAQDTSCLADVNTKKKEILRSLIVYVEHHYPGYTFEDYSRLEAGVKAAHTGFPFTWGMWVLLGHGKSELLDPVAEIPQQTAQGGDTFITNTEENWGHDQRRQIQHKHPLEVHNHKRILL